jgi:hypothetical protein
VNWQHLRTFVWLRYRLLVNRWYRAGALNAVLLLIVAIAAVLTAVPIFIGSFLLALRLIPKASPVHLLYAWDALVFGFLFFWSIGLVSELQRTEPLSLSKFLHLPVSVNGAFLLNYLSSLLRLSLIVFVPALVGFGLALVVAKGLSLLPVLPSVAAFVLMVTALTYQFQGWLAAMMNNPRSRRTVVVVTTAIFVLIFQLPNLLNYFAPWGAHLQEKQSARLAEEMEKLNREARSRKFEASELTRRQREIMQNHQLAAEEARRESVEHWEEAARLVNVALPFGWLPLGVMSAAEGRVMPAVLGLLGMSLIGTTSLWRAYGATVRQYQGQSTSRESRPAVAAAAPRHPRKPGGMLLEARLPGVTEPVSAIALAGLRSLARAPEAKMMLLSPLIMGPILGSMLWSQRESVPESVRPLVASGGMIFLLLSVGPMMGNLFGFDRDGFRVFVLSSAPRRDILLGKNLAFLPVFLVLAAILLPIVQLVCSMRLDHLGAMVPQFVSMFLLFCIFTNLLSIYAPAQVAPGSLKPVNPKLTTALLQLVVILLLFPLTQLATLVPLGIEVLLRLLGRTEGVPLCLLLSLAECVLVVFIYRVALHFQGSALQDREQKILDVVTTRAL